MATFSHTMLNLYSLTWLASVSLSLLVTCFLLRTQLTLSSTYGGIYETDCCRCRLRLICADFEPTGQLKFSLFFHKNVVRTLFLTEVFFFESSCSWTESLESWPSCMSLSCLHNWWRSAIPLTLFIRLTLWLTKERYNEESNILEMHWVENKNKNNFLGGEGGREKAGLKKDLSFFLWHDFTFITGSTHKGA